MPKDASQPFMDTRSLEQEYPIRVLERECFPPTLRQMTSPPKRLYIRGVFPHTDKEQRYLCVIGSRQWSSYGRECVETLIRGLAGYPISIVSGLAIGIDSFSHRAALEAGLHCVAFPGSTLEWKDMYPKPHVELAGNIVQAGGALISEWKPGYTTGNWAFPARNRLMAGLSHAVLIIEAARHSGSLMTATHAVDFNRDILAVPGHISAPNSYGTHMLIKRGAALVSSSYDILVGLGFNPASPTSTEQSAASDGPFVPRAIKEHPLALKLLGALDLENLNTDELVRKVHARISDINVALSLLELEGLIRIDGSKICRVRSIM